MANVGMGKSSKGNNSPRDGFIKQAGILAVAGILSRVIGLLYNSPMTAIIGDEGNGYYTFAYNAYAVVLLVSSYSIPSAISKVIAQRLAAKEYRNAHKIFKGALLYVIFVGGIASLLVYFLADDMVNLSGSATVLRFFAPTVFLSGILGVLRGYFQAHRTMAQTSFSQILEQICNAIVSIGLAYVLTKMPLGGLFSGGETEVTQKAVSGAAGGAIGTGMGVAVGLLFMWGIYMLNRNTLRKKIERDNMSEEESYGAIFKMILLVVTPFILSTCIYNINTFCNQYIFNHISMQIRGLGELEVTTLNSALGKATKIYNIPIAVSSAMSAALMPGIAGDFSLGYMKLCREKVEKAIRTTMFISIPASVGIGVLARPIMMFLYPQKDVLDLSANLLMAVAVSVIFYALSTLSGAVLQGIGKVNAPVIHASIALFVQTGVLIFALLFTDMGVYAMAAAIVLYAFLMCILNGMSMRKHLGYRQEWDKTFVRPTLASLVMGGAVFGIYQGIYSLCAVNLLALLLAVVTGVILYFVLCVKWKMVGAADLGWMPKGAAMVRLINGRGEQKKKDKKRKKKETGEDDFWLDDE